MLEEVRGRAAERLEKRRHRHRQLLAAGAVTFAFALLGTIIVRHQPGATRVAARGDTRSSAESRVLSEPSSKSSDTRTTSATMAGSSTEGTPQGTSQPAVPYLSSPAGSSAPPLRETVVDRVTVGSYTYELVERPGTSTEYHCIGLRQTSPDIRWIASQVCDSVSPDFTHSPTQSVWADLPDGAQVQWTVSNVNPAWWRCETQTGASCGGGALSPWRAGLTYFLAAIPKGASTWLRDSAGAEGRIVQ